jgi:hypothetical protein
MNAVARSAWLAFCMVSGCAAYAAGGDEMSDLAARVQFDYYAADARALRRDLQVLKDLAVADEAKRIQQYHIAYGYLKLSETLYDKDRSDARKAAGECADRAGAAAEFEPPRGTPPKVKAQILELSAELWALRGACAGLQAELSLLPGSTLVSVASVQGDSAEEKARALAPNNPRVLLLPALQAARRAGAKDRDQVRSQLQVVAAAFDVAMPAEGMPDWGHAEALAWLGQVQLQGGDRRAARDSLEQALVLASDYAWARKVLSQVNSTR